MVKNEILQSVDGLAASQPAGGDEKLSLPYENNEQTKFLCCYPGIGNWQSKGERELATKKRHK